MTQELKLIRVSRTCTYINKIVAPTEAENKKAQWRKHIEEISRHLSTEPIQSEDLTFEQQEWLEFRMSRPFPEPYRPWPKTKKTFEFKTFSFAEVLASVKPLEETDD